MHKQQGLTLTGFMVWAVVVVFALLLGFKLAPPYMEYQSIQKLVRNIANEPGIAGGDYRNAVRKAFNLRAGVDDIQAVNEKDLIITKDGDKLIITADYVVRVPIVGNINACIDFSVNSQK